MSEYDVIIIGAGAAGLMCALTAAGRGKKVLLLEHSKKAGAKILISGGGRCNFTNMDVVPSAYLSQNPHFAKSALSRYTHWDFIELISKHGATWHEKTLGQLFCDQGAGKILDILLTECMTSGVTLKTGVKVDAVSYGPDKYWLKTSDGALSAEKLVIATGGVSIPKMGATGFAYEVAAQFGVPVVEPEPALVPLVFDTETVAAMKSLAGVAADCVVSCGKTEFRENLLFTHRGLSGPAILQISSYWSLGQDIKVNLLPNIPDAFDWLREQKAERPKSTVKAVLNEVLAERLAEAIALSWPGNLADLPNVALKEIAKRLSAWRLTPTGSEGFKKAEVTRGGVSTQALSSKTMEANNQKGLYFIGECVDVTGWLGGYNFQWAWASGHACAQHL
ncbi:NAD(P)/FAD-dependent oxidoreductase [Kordiimonas laminariae]|uniref:NAD(P)/FAD-dependent oxidoreductase n=1 Tax=Kordiimonas laminariae TaxID=2917717 RepID=UPI001FF2EDF0|nr:NAD(P)/FAD-dependent oxidoreductase [Kordiimonas laminariae]MCK0069369.1 NAD(P)/FAD-dependent oxidoreductase [Kordiimonas laminariae]